MTRSIPPGLFLLLLMFLAVSSCMPKPPAGASGLNITVYGFSVMKEVLEKSIYPAFAAKWKREHGQDIRFTSSFAGSETITNQILQGVQAEVGIFSIDRDPQRLKARGFIHSDWHQPPHQGIINKTPFIILVRTGNPKGIHDFADLARPGLRLIHPDPISSGGAQWSILGIYGAELKLSEKQSGTADKARALHTLQAIWKNVISTPGSAREARTTFDLGNGDALVTYELEGLLMKEANAPVEIVRPPATIFSEHPAVIIDRNVKPDKRALVEAFMQYLWSDEVQQAFVQYHFHAVTNDAFNQNNKAFSNVEMPFGVDYFGGWERAYPEIIEGVFRDQVQRRSKQ